MANATNILILLFPLMLLISGYFKPTGKMLRHLPLTILLAVLVIIPQLFYLKHMTVDWFFYSYGNERFFFTDPEIWKGLFSYRKGWLVYSSLLIYTFAGFYFSLNSINLLPGPVALPSLELSGWSSAGGMVADSGHGHSLNTYR